jgi:hypothetical protein
VVSPDPAVPLDEFADSGATWLIHSTPPWIDGWKEDLARMAADGPPR